MSKGQKIRSFLYGIVMLFFVGVLLHAKEKGYYIIMLILAVSMLFAGLRILFFYATMARLMVGGIKFLFIGMMVLDAGIIALAIVDEPRLYIILYLTAFYAFDGVTDLLRAREAARAGGTWKLKGFFGISKLLIAAACVALVKKPGLLVLFYAGGLVYSAVMHIVSAFRSTEVISIQ